jgi:hypothetical protein
MSGRLDAWFEFVRRGLIEPLGRLGGLLVAALRSLTTGLWRFRWRVAIAAIRRGRCRGAPHRECGRESGRLVQVSALWIMVATA